VAPYSLVKSFLINVVTYTCTRPHGVTTQKTPVFITTVVGPSDLTICCCLYWIPSPIFALFTLFLHILQLTFLVFFSHFESIKLITTAHLITTSTQLYNNYHVINMLNWIRLHSCIAWYLLSITYMQHIFNKKSHQDSKGEGRKAHRELGTGNISPNNTNPAKIWQI